MGGKTYPFYIAMKDESPMALAGLWDEWVNKETGEIMRTVAIVTTRANAVMEKIHNNPKADGARMPVILPGDKQDEWLGTCVAGADKEKLKALLAPFDPARLMYHAVPRLRGREAVGNVPQAMLQQEYPELGLVFGV